VLIADALDLRHRLPRLWGRVLTGGVRAWQARKIAEQTRALSWEACADVDHALSDFVGMMPWPRFVKILSATILEADPALAAERAVRARTTQDVFSFDSEDGLKTIVAKAAAGDAIWFLARVNRIAEILAARGDADPVGTRRARALGILAQPAEALRLLIEHQHDRADQRNEPTGQAAADASSDGAPGPEPHASSDGELGCESESDWETDDHQSLSMAVPPAFDAAAARSVMCQWTTAGRRVRRDWTILVRWAARVTGQSLTAVGRSASLSPDTSYTAHPAGSSTWSPTKAPSRLVVATSVLPSGRPLRRGMKSQRPDAISPQMSSRYRSASRRPWSHSSAEGSAPLVLTR
jgi:hypothetical protein